jgi:hypothetical protein
MLNQRNKARDRNKKYKNKKEHMIFGLLGLANLAQDDVLQFHLFTCK